jgi:hypothetical protein
VRAARKVPEYVGEQHKTQVIKNISRIFVMNRTLFDAGEALVAFLYIFLPLILGLMHIKLKSDKRNKVDILLDYYLFIGVGIQGIVTGILQMNKPQMVVSFVQWPYSPFLVELGMANLAFGLLGIISVWLDKSWKVAAAAGYGLFLLFTGIGHIINIMLLGTTAGDAGAFLWSDLFVPVALFILIVLKSHSIGTAKGHDA